MRKFISLSLVVLFVVQPALTLADVHRFHQSGSEHLTFEHGHHALGNNGQDGDFAKGDTYVNTFTNKNLISNSIDGSFDCHHCCHCHSLASGVAVPVALSLECEYGESVQVARHVTRHYSPVYEKRFRPPRA